VIEQSTLSQPNKDAIGHILSYFQFQRFSEEKISKYKASAGNYLLGRRTMVWFHLKFFYFTFVDSKLFLQDPDFTVKSFRLRRVDPERGPFRSDTIGMQYGFS
jgi:hypothetical protein